jgi:hypothetical protein
VLWPAAYWGGLTGTFLIGGIGALGMVISLWSNTLKVSMSATLGIFVLIFMPFALPGKAQAGPMGYLMQLMSPLMATYDFLAKILINNRALTDKSHQAGDLLVWHHLISPIAFCVVMVTLLWVIAPGLRIEAVQRWRAMWGKKVRMAAIVAGALVLGAVALQRVAVAQEGSAGASSGSEPGDGVTIELDKTLSILSQGDSLVYNSTVTNGGGTDTPSLTVALNIINLDAAGDVVDPEDWSPQRTQYIETLKPGESKSLKWRVNGIMDGDYMVYMVVIPKPHAPDVTTKAVASHGIHLTVKPFTKLNPKGILLYVLGTPIVLVLGMVYLMRRRQKSVDRGAGAPQAGM